MKRYAIYWGCTIRVRYPSVEKAAKIVADRLGLELVEMDGVTCCPLPEVFNILLPEAWRVVGSRNISIAEKMGLDIVAICNGCYETLHKVNVFVKENELERDRINKILSRYGRSFKGNIRVKHMVEVLYNDIGLDKIKENVVRKLDFNIAIHPGCKLYERDEEMPNMFKELVEILGGRIVEYCIERLCCGIPYNYVDRDKSLRERALVKIKVLEKYNTDVLTTFCPGCMLQYESVQIRYRREISRRIPVINYMELLAYSFGFDLDEIGIYVHRIPLKMGG